MTIHATLSELCYYTDWKVIKLGDAKFSEVYATTLPLELFLQEF